ncbi:hypothetical protein B0T16DRAFT_66206 [Cercophora newfieldiana]|uniref:Uncharacterized protein n=1 Tax=Cercophora newfieldiana TaxID=92897 RepID=A0AA40CZS6_9PEZI|nr:hypothetical protein B0T16DRAFT_66206 [Cercophora newfieldiana]
MDRPPPRRNEEKAAGGFLASGTGIGIDSESTGIDRVMLSMGRPSTCSCSWSWDLPRPTRGRRERQWPFVLRLCPSRLRLSLRWHRPGVVRPAWVFGFQEAGRFKNRKISCSSSICRTWAFLRQRMGIRKSLAPSTPPPPPCTQRKYQPPSFAYIMARPCRPVRDNTGVECIEGPQNAIMLKTRMAGTGTALRPALVRGKGEGETRPRGISIPIDWETHEKRTIMIDPRGKPANQCRAAHFSFPKRREPRAPLSQQHAEFPDSSDQGLIAY